MASLGILVSILRLLLIPLLTQVPLTRQAEFPRVNCSTIGAPAKGVSKHSLSDTGCSENYVYCVNNKAFVNKCPPNTAYNPTLKECDLKESVPDCGDKNFGPQKWTAGKKFEGKEVNDCSMRDSGLYPMVFGDCKEYVQCKHNRAFAKKCPFNLIFDMEVEECRMASYAKCWRPNGANGPNKYFPLHAIEYYPNFEEEYEPLTAVMANPEGPVPPQKECPYSSRPPPKKFVADSNGIIIKNPPFKNDGQWGEWLFCPEGTYANGISTYRRSKMQKGKTDNVGVISIALQCQEPEKMGKLDEVNSTLSAVAGGAPATDGQFSRFWTCEDGGAAIGFQVNSEPDQGEKDDIATGNVRLTCSCGPPAVKPYWLEGVYTSDANRAGEWTMEQACQVRQAVCGMQVQMQDYVDKVDLINHDNTGVNNIKMKCCDIPNPISYCSPMEREVLVATCNNTASEGARSCEFDAYFGVGYDYNQPNERSVYFHQSTGFTLDYQLPILQQRMAGDDLHCGFGHCLFPWNNATASVWKAEQHGLLRSTVVGGWNAEIFQIVGQCGIYIIYTNRYMRMDSDGFQVQISRDFWDIEHLPPPTAMQS